MCIRDSDRSLVLSEKEYFTVSRYRHKHQDVYKRQIISHALVKLRTPQYVTV